MPLHAHTYDAATQEPLSQAPCLTFPLQQAENVPFPHGSFHIANDTAVRVIQELNSHLRDTAGVARPAQNPVNFRKLDCPCCICHIYDIFPSFSTFSFYRSYDSKIYEFVSFPENALAYLRITTILKPLRMSVSPVAVVTTTRMWYS